MAMVVNHNIPALQTYNVVNSTSSALQKSINKLSTGLRINSAADDAAGLAISEKMRAQVRGLDQATANSQDGISMIQTAEGALNETHSILQRMRELSVQAANDTLTQQDRGYIQEEVDQLREEITRIGNTTQFNKKKLLNGDAAALWSSSDSETKALIRGGLRTIDQFGQKSSVEGNYNIKIRAEAGQGEVQKSDIFTIKHADSISNETLNKAAGINDISVNNLPAASYRITSGTATAVTSAAKNLTGVFNVDDSYTKNTATLTFKAGATAATDSATVTVSLGGKDVDVTYSVASAATATGAATAFANAAKSKLASLGISVAQSAGTANVTLTAMGDDASFTTTATGARAAFLPTTNNSTASTTDMSDFETNVVTAAVSQTGINVNASVLFEVTDVDTTAGTVTLKASVKTMDENGNIGSKTVDDIILKEGATAAELGAKLGLGSATGFTMGIKTGASFVFHEGSKFVYNLTPDSASTSAMKVTVQSDVNGNWPDKWDNAPTRTDPQYVINSETVGGKDLHLQQYYLNENTGEVMEGDIVLKTDADNFNKTNSAEQTLASFDANYVGQTANGGTKLRDLDKFWDASGNFLLTDPQTITITQGDGKSASVTLYANDTLDDVAKKFNDAIAQDLGQAKYLESGDKGVDKFATFTTGAGTSHDVTQKDNTSQSVAGTFLIRSLTPGTNGELRFSGAEDVINAFSLNEIQASTETKYTASITDAHTGKSIASNVQVTGNKLIGVIDDNVDVEFDAMAGIKASWSDDQKQFGYKSSDYETTLHLSDNTTVFQIGANEGEDMGINIGDMRSHALGLDEVNVTNRESAARSITVIDNAIDRVSMQRSKLGAYQNRLEHTINNLATASENMTSAESRIRDTDMAKEMMNFSKLQIMLQAGNSMLAQANQLPQNVLSLVR